MLLQQSDHFSLGWRAAVGLMHDCSAQWQHASHCHCLKKASAWHFSPQMQSVKPDPQGKRAAFSESISSGAEGLTGTHTSDQLSEESLITSAMKKKQKTNPFTWDESHSKDNFDFCTTGKRAKKPAWLSEAHLNGLHSVHPQMQRCSF